MAAPSAVPLPTDQVTSETTDSKTSAPSRPHFFYSLDTLLKLRPTHCNLPEPLPFLSYSINPAGLINCKMSFPASPTAGRRGYIHA
ncbi:hypothetical protein O181_070074 [Austropuccinia psidii MF-1]|uniref:Uncharacterized protein n=1 Tax=Austropuccinia psidii MF-1 TaxID=1389203 RepID=A0A9Q3F0I7_9BASI|nr:hypothetical protein [Austropuccinia psidii MF-1]